jgi:hypothetical protein
LPSLRVFRTNFPDEPKNHEYTNLSIEEEAHGLYRETSRIGFKQNWDKLLRERGLSYHGHRLIAEAKQKPGPEEETGSTIQVQRHRTAMSRSELSKPVREVLNLGLIPPGQTFFDYGCGHGYFQYTARRRHGTVRNRRTQEEVNSNEPKTKNIIQK